MLTPRRSSTKVRQYLPVLAAVIVLCGFADAAFAGPPYTFTKIQVPGAMRTEASGINNSGQTVGTYWSFDGTVHGFIFDGTTYTTVDYPGAPYTFAFGISAGGQIVGTYGFSALGPWSGLLADHGTFSGYDFLGQQTDGRAINVSGNVSRRVL